MYSLYGLLVFLALFAHEVQGQYVDNRCKCVCRYQTNATKAHGRVFINSNVSPEDCFCPKVVEPKLDTNNSINCNLCKCNYQSRNSTTIMLVVIFILGVLLALVFYMLFLTFFEPLINKRSSVTSYQEHHDDDEEPFGPVSMNSRTAGNVLHRVGNQQVKWKKQVMEQRKNIYDRHTMLN